MSNLKPMVGKGEFDRKSFSGEWNSDEKVKGTMIYKDGEKYEGELFEDVPHGKGVKKFECGDIYKGDFQDGLRNGSGIYTWPSGSKHDGSWYKNKRHGIGDKRFADGNI